MTQAKIKAACSSVPLDPLVGRDAGWLDAECIFGLAAQGHIPVIEEMLANGRTWHEIGRVIGWEPKTAREHYERLAPNADVTGLPPAQTVELPPKPAGGRSELT